MGTNHSVAETARTTQQQKYFNSKNILKEKNLQAGSVKSYSTSSTSCYTTTTAQSLSAFCPKHSTSWRPPEQAGTRGLRQRQNAREHFRPQLVSPPSIARPRSSLDLWQRVPSQTFTNTRTNKQTITYTSLPYSITTWLPGKWVFVYSRSAA